MSILDVLADKKVITQKELASIEKEAHTSADSLEAILIKRGITPDTILKTLGEYFDLPTRILGEENVINEVLAYIPEESAIHYKFVPLGVVDGALEVGIVDPDNIEARDALNFISSKINLPFKIFVITQQDFDRVILMYRGLSEEVTKALSQLDTVGGSVTFAEDEMEPKTESSAGKKVDQKIIEEAPITKIVTTIIRYAAEGNASDIHIEHMKETIRVRFRVDGVLNTSLVLPAKVHAPVISRIKLQCNMKLDEKRKPQDGRFSAKVEGRRIDFRVSTFPTYYGEKIVMRILDQTKGIRTLDDLGISKKNLEIIRKAIERPYGLILISGPTGSGKTTTLYAMLSEFDREKNNVLSLEDPIEYNVEGVNQSQVHPEIGYSFATGLRTTLRQDPDIIMVGEIRDEETAELAIQASLTGHLVLATIHTNNAVGVIPRLIDMKVDPYLVAPTLILAMAQRLVGMLVPDSIKEVPVEGSIKAVIDREFADLPDKFKKELTFGKTVFKAVPGPNCPTGTRGRMAVMEVLEMDKELENAILKSPTEQEITKVARAKGMLTMKEDAILKAFNKQIPFEEVIAL